MQHRTTHRRIPTQQRRIGCQYSDNAHNSPCSLCLSFRILAVVLITDLRSIWNLTLINRCWQSWLQVSLCPKAHRSNSRRLPLANQAARGSKKEKNGAGGRFASSKFFVKCRGATHFRSQQPNGLLTRVHNYLPFYQLLIILMLYSRLSFASNADFCFIRNA